MNLDWLNPFFWAIAAAYLVMTLGFLFHLRWTRRLPPLEALKPAGDCPRPETVGGTPRVSVVLAARNEAARIENTVLGLLAQKHVEIEVLVVDDRSTDGTTAILRRLADGDRRVQVRRVEVLPEGWLGKCHACHLGASAATGNWILFTDGDCWLKEDVIARALRVAGSEGVEHVALTPGIVPAGAGAAAWHLAFLLSLSKWISAVNRDRPRAYVGMGAFNLVQAAAYRACGGYSALRLTIVDDLKLGLLLRRAGHRTRGFIGSEDVVCDWGATLRKMMRIMEKNYFAAVDYRLGLVAGFCAAGAVCWGSAILGALAGSPGGIAAGLGLLSLSLPAGVAASRLGWSMRFALLTPFIFPVLIYAVLNSAVLTLSRGGIRWRDTFYPLEQLRQGTVR